VNVEEFVFNNYNQPMAKAENQVFCQVPISLDKRTEASFLI